MKSFLLLLTFALAPGLMAHAEGDCKTSVLSPELNQIATGMQVPNCLTSDNLDAADEKDFTPLCKECRHKFEEALKRNAGAVKKAPLDLSGALLNELKKSLSANLMDIVNLRSIYSTNADFSGAIKACDLDAFEKELQQSPCSKGIKLNTLKDQMAEELGQLLSSSPSASDKGILDRSSSKASCEISDVAILRVSSFKLEEALDANLVTALAKINVKDKQTLAKSINDLESQFHLPLLSFLNSHPVFSSLMSPPENFTSFFKKLPTPIKIEQLRAALYGQKQNNELLTDKIAKRCQSAFSTFKSLACHSDIKSGRAKIAGLKDAEFVIGKIQPLPDDFVDLKKSEDIESHHKLFSVCDSRSKDAIDFQAVVKPMTEWMPKEYTSVPYDDYRKKKYENDIGKTKTALCEIKQKGGKCDDSTLNCQLYRHLEKTQDTNTPEGRLASSSDKNVNTLLRSFIGTPDKISEAARATLIKEGILPMNDKGELAAQPEVPERSTEFVNKMAEMAKPQPSSSVASSPTTPSVTPKTTPNKTAPTVPSTIGNTLATPAKAITPVTPSSATPDPEMKAIDDEILRRLSDSKTPPTKEEARKVAREVLKEKGKSFTPAQEQTIADSALASFNSRSTSSGDFPPEEKATLTPGDTPKEKWEKEQKLRALAGMQGAQKSAAGRAPASADAEGKQEDKKLSTVALNISDDKVKLNLSDVLDEKILNNDSEGQLLKVFILNKKDFILQVNNTSFKVKYDKSKGRFTISFENGDNKEAKRLRSQLEKFFNRVNAYAMN